jgi:hypothetical protein
MANGDLVDASVNLAAEFVVLQGNEDLFAEFFVNQGAVDLLAEFEVQQETSIDLLGAFVVRHPGSVNLLGEFLIRKTATLDLAAEFVIRRSASLNLAAQFIVRHTATLNLHGQFIVRQEASVDLLGEFIIQHTSSVTLGSLFSKFAVRHVYPYWTNRRYINGVIDAAEKLIGDAKLEFVIEGVMDDIKVWAAANTVSYDSWTNIDITPIAIKRATTYGAVAALYARHTKTFQGQVIPTLAPVTVTVTGDQEKAMEHWEGKMEEMLQLYLTAQGFERIWISTADEEPVFTMADIPADVTDETSWLEWLRLREV